MESLLKSQLKSVPKCFGEVKIAKVNKKWGSKHTQVMMSPNSIKSSQNDVIQRFFSAKMRIFFRKSQNFFILRLIYTISAWEEIPKSSMLCEHAEQLYSWPVLSFASPFDNFNISLMMKITILSDHSISNPYLSRKLTCWELWKLVAL